MKGLLNLLAPSSGETKDLFPPLDAEFKYLGFNTERNYLSAVTLCFHV